MEKVCLWNDSKPVETWLNVRVSRTEGGEQLSGGGETCDAVVYFSLPLLLILVFVQAAHIMYHCGFQSPKWRSKYPAILISSSTAERGLSTNCRGQRQLVLSQLCCCGNQCCGQTAAQSSRWEEKHVVEGGGFPRVDLRRSGALTRTSCEIRSLNLPSAPAAPRGGGSWFS
ncbi:unnamed protein product [Pleuronectes platessa]|uniref:Uncharacterized protein n=1 Tax=Pleuronectes platessa TaxID=8262 RepID=A0A9N7UV10_PLEPL|nr:unnamed protein product [Pleuronectes platessa]